LALTLSVVLGIWTLTTANVAPIVGGLQLPLASTSTVALSVGGYVLTPLGTIAAYAWDQTAQRRGLRNRNFGLMPQYTRILRYVAGVGFIVAAWHILNIANAIAGGV
jgi:hypothetical protein